MFPFTVEKEVKAIHAKYKSREFMITKTKEDT